MNKVIVFTNTPVAHQRHTFCNICTQFSKIMADYQVLTQTISTNARIVTSPHNQQVAQVDELELHFVNFTDVNYNYVQCEFLVGLCM